MPEAQTEFIPLARRFYEPTAQRVAPRLLGHWLVRRTPAGLSGGIIVEGGDIALSSAPLACVDGAKESAVKLRIS